MAASLAYDVFNFMNSRGSPVYVCSLGAEGAFDGIQHAINFQKEQGITADRYWRILVYWYCR